MIEAAALIATATLFGGMVCFSFLFAPLVFAKLPEATAGAFIRGVFPWYYLAVAALGAVAAAALWPLAPVLGWVAAAVALGAVLARQVAMPAINRARDRELAGDGTAKRRFALLHGGTVVLNLVQIAALLGILIALAGGAPA